MIPFNVHCRALKKKVIITLKVIIAVFCVLSVSCFKLEECGLSLPQPDILHILPHQTNVAETVLISHGRHTEVASGSIPGC